ncbi:MAG: P-loop NTPase [Acidiferrobacterales bacterium]|nr:P-loop NTPase [Acidiferrobacterales bacterium]
MINSEYSRNTIIPVAGGKGGTGKSITAANLSIALARRGHRVVAVDLDLGGSNLHSYLGLENTLSSIGDFLSQKNAELDDYLHSTPVPNLRFLPGDGRTPFLANMGYTNKIKLIRRLHKIEADYVILDLGAGSTFNTLDHFSLAAHGLLVTTGDRTAMMGMLMFVKNFLYRVVSRNLKEFPEGLATWNRLLEQSNEQSPLTISQIIAEIETSDPDAAREIERLTRFYRPRLILNAGTHPDELTQKLNRASDAMRSMLGIDPEHFGFVFADPAVSESVEAGLPLLDYAPDSLAARSFSAIAGRIPDMWQESIENSRERLYRNTQNIFRTLWSEGEEK